MSGRLLRVLMVKAERRKDGETESGARWLERVFYSLTTVEAVED
jgi:hypothetical protein